MHFQAALDADPDRQDAKDALFEYRLKLASQEKDSGDTHSTAGEYDEAFKAYSLCAEAVITRDVHQASLDLQESCLAGMKVVEGQALLMEAKNLKGTADDHYSNGDWSNAVSQYDLAVQKAEEAKSKTDDTTGAEKLIAALEKKKGQAERKLEAEMKKQQEQKEQLARELYAATLQEHYYDEGLDIKVSVEGKDSTTLRLKYVLFTDVWIHHFKKSPQIQEQAALGFKKVILSDGFRKKWTISFN
jgi:hypothetical protein